VLHNPRVTSVRAPRVRALINGVLVDSIMHVDIVLSGSCKSSRFELTASTLGKPSSNLWLDSLDGKVTVEILMRSQFSDNDVSMFEGLADSISVDPLNRTTRIQGRDFSSILIDSTYDDAFCNQTAGEIANYISDRHGFNANITATSAMVGSYQGDGHSQVLLNAHSRITSEWDLLTQLAKTEGFELFVDGTTLVFAPSVSLSRNYLSIDSGNVKEIKFHKRCPLSGQTRLTVKSWNLWLNQVSLFTDDQSSDVAAPDVTNLNDTPGTEIAIVRPNLTPQGAERLAQQYSAAFIEQQLKVEIVMPGEFLVRPLDVLSVSGSGAGFDTDYIVRSVRRHFSSTAGFVEYIQGFAIGANSVFSLASVAS
jgi:hypothetical protein